MLDKDTTKPRRPPESFNLPSRGSFSKVSWKFLPQNSSKIQLPSLIFDQKAFFTSDSRMLNFEFLWPRNEIWKLLGVFWNLSNALDANYAAILKKMDFASQSFIFTSIYLYWALHQLRFELWWAFHKCNHVGGCSERLLNFFRDAQDDNEPHTHPYGEFVWKNQSLQYRCPLEVPCKKKTLF